MKSPYGLDIIESCVTCDIRKHGFFCSLPKAALQVFENISSASSYPRDALLFLEGQEPRGIFVICQGKVKLSLASRDGKTVILKIAGPGEVLGLNATVLGQPYEVTAQTAAPTQLNFVRREAFLRFLSDNAAACMRAAEQLSATCQTAYDQIRSLGLSHSAGEKLARVLLEWAEGGESTEQGIRLKLALTHEEIAQMIGSSRETVTRLFADLQKRRIIRRNGSTLLLRDRAALQALLT